ncbi:unnamed protein product [Callosobruchus maculatus]|uniref:Uncharacterized protein n=1 Tax=Callosobruchus maculatus TaxID=64391 RepID=A0A653CVD2_CALMS|nr:unnamed protein product [Callosobruchus maculatus]
MSRLKKCILLRADYRRQYYSSLKVYFFHILCSQEAVEEIKTSKICLSLSELTINWSGGEHTKIKFHMKDKDVK